MLSEVVDASSVHVNRISHQVVQNGPCKCLADFCVISTFGVNDFAHQGSTSPQKALLQQEADDSDAIFRSLTLISHIHFVLVQGHCQSPLVGTFGYVQSQLQHRHVGNICIVDLVEVVVDRLCIAHLIPCQIVQVTTLNLWIVLVFGCG